MERAADSFMIATAISSLASSFFSMRATLRCAALEAELNSHLTPEPVGAGLARSQAQDVSVFKSFSVALEPAPEEGRAFPPQQT